MRTVTITYANNSKEPYHTEETLENMITFAKRQALLTKTTIKDIAITDGKATKVHPFNKNWEWNHKQRRTNQCT